MKNLTRSFLCCVLLVCVAAPSQAAESLRERIQDLKETRAHRAEGNALVNSDQTKGAEILSFEGRESLVYVPKTVKPERQRGLIMVFHGGMGNAGHIRATLNMDSVADQDGFIIAYINGLPAAQIGEKHKAWNAGGECCGQPAKQNVDDVGYITRLADHLQNTYHIAPDKIFGIGHSNGAMMIQRVACEAGVFSAIVPVSGPLNYTPDNRCAKAKGMRILSLHGSADENVFITGGYGKKGITDVAFQPQSHSKAVFEAAGADYTLQVLDGVDHGLDHVSQYLQKTEGVSLGQKAAMFFGLDP